MVDAIQFSKTGGADVLRKVTLASRAPGAGEVRLRHTAIGLNFIDVYHRSGLYPVPLPAIPGLEAAGVIEEVGPGVALAPGMRVAYGRGPLGAYASERIIAAKECIPLPDSVTDAMAASVMLKGLTAWYLLHQTFPVRRGDSILIHAVAGGVGQILCQWAKHLGARVIGTAGSEEKARRARAIGCDDIIFYRTEDVAKRVRVLTGGKGVPVVYDAVGKDTFTGSLDSLAPLGMMVSYGQASGPIPPFDLRELAKRGSLFITRPGMMDYMREDATYAQAAQAVFALLASGKLVLDPPQQFALADAAAAHKALEGRQTMGSTILVP